MNSEALKSRRLSSTALALLLGSLVHSPAAIAQEADAQQVLIAGPGDVTGNSGRLSINAAAGNENQQVSSAVIAIGEIATAHETVIQRSAKGGPDETTALVISGDALSGNSGLISLNITAGSQNQSANLASFAIGQSGALTDQLLEQSRAPTQPSGGNEAGSAMRNDSVAISDDAFGESSGLFQANLVGGERNSSANTFSLVLSTSGQP